jgi:Dual specificity phosphatase, catalytic domain
MWFKPIGTLSGVRKRLRLANSMGCRIRRYILSTGHGRDTDYNVGSRFRSEKGSSFMLGLTNLADIFSTERANSMSMTDCRLSTSLNSSACLSGFSAIKVMQAAPAAYPYRSLEDTGALLLWKVLPDLFLGDYGDAKNVERLRAHQITHILNCSRELPCKFESEFTYFRLELDDPDPSFAGKIEEFCAFINEGRRHGKVLVHCTMATSRSPAVVLAYLCQLEGCVECAVECLSRVVATGINEAFFYQLGRYMGIELTAGEVESLQRRLLNTPD